MKVELETKLRSLEWVCTTVSLQQQQQQLLLLQCVVSWVSLMIFSQHVIHLACLVPYVQQPVFASIEFFDCRALTLDITLCCTLSLQLQILSVCHL